jgi:DNA polymerase-1
LIALIDGDLVAYRSAASCQPTKAKADLEPLEVAIARADECMRRILHNINAQEYRCFIGGGDNFRYKIDPNYKANRKDMPRPEWLQDVREYLVSTWKTQVCDGIEADDAMGIAQSTEFYDTIICSLDKDMLQVPGNHYNWVREEATIVSPRQGWVNFYTQLIMGDRADNIPGYDGKMRQKVPQFLQPFVDDLEHANDAAEMFRIVHSIYELGDEAMLRNGKLLYILRDYDETWGFPV